MGRLAVLYEFNIYCEFPSGNSAERVKNYGVLKFRVEFRMDYCRSHKTGKTGKTRKTGKTGKTSFLGAWEYRILNRTDNCFCGMDPFPLGNSQ